MSSRTLSTLATLGALTLANIVGCSPQRGLRTSPRTEDKPVNYSIPNIIGNYALGKITNEQAKFDEEAIVIWGKPYLSFPNKYRRASEADFILLALDEVDTRRELTNKTIELKTENVYISTQVILDDKTPAKRATLSSEGPRGIKAEKKHYDTKNVQTGILNLTHEDEQFGLETVFINSKEFFTPLAQDDKINEQGFLPFYLIPKESSIIETNPKGIITIENPGKIFRPKAVSANAYKERQTSEQKVKEFLEETREEDELMKPKTGSVKEIK